jgi:uncharacterized repeat protein (TIGR03843 family)
MTKPPIFTALELDKPLELPYDVVMTALKDGAVDTEHGIMRFGSNYTFLVTVQHNDVAFLAIYKPRDGETPLWDFPDGTLCRREYGAWLLDNALDWNIVPPTVLTENASRGMGSLQVFINHDPNQHYFNFTEQHLEQVKRIFAFDLMLNNADRKGGHVLLDECDHVWGIDHGLSFNHVPKLRTVMWEFGREANTVLAGTKIPEAVMQDIQALCVQIQAPDCALTLELSSMFSIQEMNALKRRIDKIMQTGTYPLPGMGAGRPWPSV